MLLQVSASKNEGRGRKSILVENKEGMRKRIEGDCTKVMKESYKIESKKGQTKEAVLKPFVQKKEMTVDHTVHLTSTGNPVSGNQEFCLAPTRLW